MPTLKLHYDGWLLLPAALRRQLGLNSGDRLDVQLVDGTIVLRPATKAKRSVDHADLEEVTDPPAPDTAGNAAQPDAAPTRRGPGRPRKHQAGADLASPATQAATWSAKADPCAGGRTTACAYGQQRTMEAAAQGRSAAAGGACRACSAAEPPALSDAQRSWTAGRRATPVPQCRGAQAWLTAPAQRVPGIVPDRTQSGRPSALADSRPDIDPASAGCPKSRSSGRRAGGVRRILPGNREQRHEQVRADQATGHRPPASPLARVVRGLGATRVPAVAWPCRARPCRTSKPAKSCSSVSTVCVRSTVVRPWSHW